MPIVMMAILTGHIWENMGTLNDYPVDLGSRNLETNPSDGSKNMKYVLSDDDSSSRWMTDHHIPLRYQLWLVYSTCIPIK